MLSYRVALMIIIIDLYHNIHRYVPVQQLSLFLKSHSNNLLYIRSNTLLHVLQIAYGLVLDFRNFQLSSIHYLTHENTVFLFLFPPSLGYCHRILPSSSFHESARSVVILYYLRYNLRIP